MKIVQSVLAALLMCVAPIAIGCSAPSGEEPTESTGNSSQDLINNGGGPNGLTQGDLEDQGYTCGIVGTFPGIKGVMTCVKAGAPTFTCTAAGVCTQALVRPPPIAGPIRGLPIGPVNGVSATQD